MGRCCTTGHVGTGGAGEHEDRMKPGEGELGPGYDERWLGGRPGLG
jgi:hypothetical protein